MSVPNTPPRLAVDAKGYVWRVYEDGAAWSMAPINPDNSPIPHPVTYYEPVTNPAEPTDGLRDALARWLMDDYVDPCSPHFWNETGDAGRKDYLDEAGRLLAGPLAPLLAKLRAVEELADTYERQGGYLRLEPIAADLRRALGGER